MSEKEVFLEFPVEVGPDGVYDVARSLQQRVLWGSTESDVGCNIGPWERMLKICTGAKTLPEL